MVDSPFSSAVKSDLKVSLEQVIADLVESMKNQNFEIRTGLTKAIYQTYLRSPEKALIMVNAATGA
ncbi:hypothetical protein [Chryseobacterium sp. JK1]|uniref:hypothetical protein n=1 Tax=Chryseobacterium sp. JK1 TaxID=874294 RepID=UPI003D683C12